MPTRFMCALVILNAVEEEIIPLMGARAPEMIWDPTAALTKRIEAGEPADGICAIEETVQILVAQRLIDPASVVPVVQAEFGIAVGLDMPAARLNDASDLIALLRAAPSVCYSRAGASGIYFESLIDRLGIGAEVRAKSTVIPAGLTGEKVRDGVAALAIQQMSELRAVPGIRIIGPLPPDCQQTTDFAAGIFTNAADPSGAADFIRALTSADAKAAYVARGLKIRF